MKNQLIILKNFPVEILALAFFAMILTEIIKYPVKSKFSENAAAGWLWIFVSIFVGVAVYCFYWFLCRPMPHLDTEIVDGVVQIKGTYFDWGSMAALVCMQQTLYNLLWDKGIRVLVKKIIGRVKKRKAADAKSDD